MCELFTNKKKENNEKEDILEMGVGDLASNVNDLPFISNERITFCWAKATKKNFNSSPRVN